MTPIVIGLQISTAAISSASIVCSPTQEADQLPPLLDKVKEAHGRLEAIKPPWTLETP